MGFKRFLMIFTPVCVLCLFAVLAGYRQELWADLRVLMAEQQYQADLQAVRISQILRDSVSELIYLAQGYELAHWPAQPGPDEKAVLAWQLADLLRNKRVYDQARFLDPAGNEVVRVNFRDGGIRMVPEEELQNKAGRYYFSESVNLKAGEVFISPMDLNIEHGEIEQPLKPTLRLATPVFDTAGRKRGVVVLNFLGQQLLLGLTASEGSLGQPMLINAQGYWLRGLKPEDEWGFMLPGRQHARFAEVFPEAWSVIARRDTGQVSTAQGLFTFVSVRTPGVGPATPAWKVVFYVSTEARAYAVRDLREKYGAILLGLWLAAGIVSTLLTRAQTRRLQAEQALAQSEHRIKAVLEAAADGIITLNEGGVVMGFNPAAEQLFGYSAAEIVGQDVQTIVAPRLRPTVPKVIAKLVSGGQWRAGQSRLETTGLHKDGTELPLELSISLATLDGRPLLIGIVSDIRQRKQVEALISAEREKLRQFVEHAPVAVAMLDREMRYLMVSQRWLDEYAADDPDLVGKSHYDAFPDVPDRWRENNRRCLAGEVLGSDRDMFAREDGSVEWVRWAMRPWHEADGQVGGIMLFVENITEKVRAEDERERFFSLSFDLMAIAGVDGYFKQANPAWEKTLGYTRDELLARPFMEFVHPDDREATARQIEKVMNEGVITRFDNRFVTSEGNARWFSWNALSLPEQGLIYAQGRDVTERRRMEDALREREERLRAILENAVEGILTVNHQGLVQSFNPAAEKIFGYKAAEVIGRNVAMLQPEPYHSEHDGYLARYMQSGRSAAVGISREVEGRRRDGSRFPMLLSVSEIRLGDRVLFSGILRDISAQKQAEQELRQAKEEADRANRAKSDFLASMSHEIRTPMNAIIGMSELLADTPLNPDQSRYVQAFQAAGENLLGIINDILDLSKVEAGRMHLERAAFDLGDLVEHTCVLLAPRAQAKGLEFNCRVAPGLPALMVGDQVRLRQVLVNLLGNAVKFTETGEIALTVSPAPEAAGPDEMGLHFMVRDTGVGIAPEKLESVFESFTQADPTITRKYGGTGLGLTISRRLVELMGGRIWVESQPGQGSTFHFTVGLQAGGQPAPRPERPGLDITDLRVLVVDDNATSGRILAETLTLWGAQVSLADCGQAGLEAEAQARERGNAFDLIITDHRMPDLDGDHLIETMRAQAPDAAPTVIMVSSDNRSEDRQRAQQLGIAEYLVKPVRRADLREAIARALGRAPASGQVTPAAELDALAPGKPLSILVVDDSPDNRMLIQALLRKYPYRLEEAGNGSEALAKFQAGRFDLVLMDIQMPQVDGYTATRSIRRWEAEQGRQPTPVVALTAFALEEERLKSLAAGCNDHLAKPVRKKDLLEAIARNTGEAGPPAANAGEERA